MAILTSNQVCNICCIHYNAGLRCCALGSAVEGGYLFAKYGGRAWIVACSSREVGRTWYCRADAVTVAQASNACGDWFVPSRTDLVLGQACKAYWNSYSPTRYWSDTGMDTIGTPVHGGFGVVFDSGHFDTCNSKTSICCVRAFRRVFY